MGQTVLNVKLLDEVAGGPSAARSDQDVAAALVDLVHDELQA
jgi:hypothetical protein